MGTITGGLREGAAAAGRIWVTLAVCVAATLASLWEAVASALQFDRQAIAVDHEYWRLMTGHLTHFNLEHFFLDVLMFVILGGICERKSRRLFVWCLVAAMVAISLTIVWLAPGTSFYRGLSGVDSAMFTLAGGMLLIEAWRRCDTVAALGIVCIFAGFIAKVCYEMMTGATLFVDSHAAGFVPIPLAHAVGAAVGIAVWWAYCCTARGEQWHGGGTRTGETPVPRWAIPRCPKNYTVTLSSRQASSYPAARAPCLSSRS